MTLKPSKKKHKKQKKQKKTKTKKRKKHEKNKNTQKWVFQLPVNFFFFLGGCPKFPFFDNLAQKTRTLKTL